MRFRACGYWAIDRSASVTIHYCGGIAEKNPLLMQIYADVTGCTMYIASSSQACALGSAISAAVLAGSEKGGVRRFSFRATGDDLAQARKLQPKARKPSDL
jgi:ribulose kinase